MENEELDPLYAAVFENPENGTPDNISQAGCLALARLGKEAWNAWREKFPVSDKNNIANFNGVDFRSEPINFDGFTFGDEANFQNTKFKVVSFAEAIFFAPDFSNAIFEEWASFISAKLSFADFKYTQFKGTANFAAIRINGAQFYKAKFSEATFVVAELGGNVCFSECEFYIRADFSGTKFGRAKESYNSEFGKIWFSEVKFFGEALFTGSVFDNEMDCSDIEFHNYADFQGAQFRENVFFTNAKFKTINFKGAQFAGDAKFDGSEFCGDAVFISSNWQELLKEHKYLENSQIKNKNWADKYGYGLAPDSFKAISFAGAKFKGSADFSGRTFTGATSFGRLPKTFTTQLPKDLRVKFSKAPLFHNCKLHQDTTFDDADFPQPSKNPIESDIAARAYRTLKLAFSQHQAIREEQRFFRLEMAEEAARAPGKLKWMFWLYSYFSDYGFSLSRPMYLLLATLFIFALIYTGLADLTSCWLWTEGCQIKSELWQFTLMQALPLPGFDKWSESLREALFPKYGWQSALLTVFVMLHKAIALLAVFLFGLALRNLFKMK